MHIDISKKDLRLRTEPQGGGCVLLPSKPCGQKRRMFSLCTKDSRRSEHTQKHGVSCITELENRGLLERIPRYHIQGGRRSSLYRVKGEITKAGGGADV